MLAECFILRVYLEHTIEIVCTVRSTRSTSVTAKTPGSNRSTALQSTASVGGARPNYCEYAAVLTGLNRNILEASTDGILSTVPNTASFRDITGIEQ